MVYGYTPLTGAEHTIYERISDISVSMKALDWLDMPKQVMVNHYVDMEPDEQKLYEEMKNQLLVELNGDVIDAANAGVLSVKLLQMANGAVYNADKEMRVIHDRKLEMLGDLNRTGQRAERPGSLLVSARPSAYPGIPDGSWVPSAGSEKRM